MRVLIVEDEALIRQGIEVMVRNAPIDINDIALARNGVEALDYLKDHTVDIVITDVKMPKMDGIELVKRIHELHDKPFIIVITGFSDFNYVVEMLRYGANDYLLKPIDRAYLHGTLEKIAGQNKLKHAEKRIRSEVIEYQLNKFLSETLEDQAFYDTFKEYLPEELKEVYVNCYQNQIVFQNCIVDCGVVNGNRYTITSSPQSFGISVASENSIEILKAIKVAKKKREYQFFSTAVASVDVVSVIDLEGYRKEVHAHITQKQPFLEQLFMELCQQVKKGTMNPIDADIVMKFCFRIIMDTYERFSEKSKSYSLLDLMAYKDASEYCEALKVWEHEFLEIMSQEFEDFQTKNQIQEAINYIEAHYHEPINMAVVSNEVSMNYTMFSHCFKYYVGQNFVVYLRDLRIKKAKKLLVETNMMVKDICERVGFTDTKHFMKLFKTETGLSPSQYRKSHKKV